MTIEEAMKKCEEIMRAAGANAHWFAGDNPIKLYTNIAYNEDGQHYLMTEAELWRKN